MAETMVMTLGANVLGCDCLCRCHRRCRRRRSAVPAKAHAASRLRLDWLGIWFRRVGQGTRHKGG